MARDEHDANTADLVGGRAKSAAERYRAYSARLKERGYKRRAIWLHEPTWRAGYAAGEAGESMTPPAGCEDRLAWISGYLEGQGRR